MAVWLRDYMDQHMTVLLSASGPFNGCKPSGHGSHGIKPLPTEPMPTPAQIAAVYERVYGGVRLLQGRHGNLESPEDVGMSGKQATLGLVAAGAMFVCGLLGLVTIFGGGNSGAGTTGACNQIGVTATGQPPLTEYYLAAAKRFKLGATGYAYLAAINEVETTFGTNLAVSTAGAVGWMQFEPATFKQYAVSVSDPAAPADPDDPQDAIYTAAHMLSADGAPKAWSTAIYAYNHASWYVQEVERKAASFEGASGEKALADAITQAWGGRTQPTLGHARDRRSLVRRRPQQQLAGACSKVVADITQTVAPVPGAAAVIMPSGLARPPERRTDARAGDDRRGRPHHWL